tara:strand:+ start:947 stop:2047 length:1101 start_codon:yes stop_codon:yes gene_type:complete
MARRPIQLDPPGEVIREELEARDWTQSDLAKLMGRTVATVNEIVNGKRKITHRTAEQLEEAFGIDSGFWMRLELEYQESIRPEPRGVSEMSKLMNFAPIKEMQRRGWLPKTNSTPELRDAVLAFFQCSSLDEKPALAAAFRQSSDDLTISHMAWCSYALRKSAAQKVSPFKSSKYDELRQSLRELAAHKEGIRKVPSVLADYGVRFVIVKHLRSTKIDGATLWLDKDSKKQPVIALSLRYGRVDNFWFTLCHEVSHVFHRDSFRLDSDIASATAGDETDEVEERANQEAASTLISPEEISRFILRKQPYFSAKSIIQFANRIKIHPGVVVGQLMYKKAIKYTHSTKMLEQIREVINETAVSDGWTK